MSFDANAERLYLFVLTQFRTESRFTFFLEMLSSSQASGMAWDYTPRCKHPRRFAMNIGADTLQEAQDPDACHPKVVPLWESGHA
jgi:hypothetical protein